METRARSPFRVRRQSAHETGAEGPDAASPPQPCPSVLNRLLICTASRIDRREGTADGNGGSSMGGLRYRARGWAGRQTMTTAATPHGTPGTAAGGTPASTTLATATNRPRSTAAQRSAQGLWLRQQRRLRHHRRRGRREHVGDAGDAAVRSCGPTHWRTEEVLDIDCDDASVVASLTTTDPAQDGRPRAAASAAHQEGDGNHYYG